MKKQETEKFKMLLASLPQQELKIYKSLFKDWEKFDEDLYVRNCKKYGIKP